MPLIVRPISANIVKDADFFDKAVIFILILGSLLHYQSRKLETAD